MLNNTTKPYALFACVLILGIAIGWLANTQFDSTPSTEKQPLYWVAPMDDNYRRDAPGLSPMGMDLVPVYDKQNGDSAGTITVSPHTINNLGVRTSIAKYRTLNQKISAPGVIHYNEDTMEHIHPRVEGWIETLYVKSAGERVKKGQALYDLYSPELVNAQQEFLAELKRNNQSLINAAQERLKALQVSHGFIKELKTKKVVSQTVTFFAPQSGVINNLNIRQGFYVKPSTTIMSIASLYSVWIKAQITSSQAHLIKMGQTALITHANESGKPLTGKINHIHPSIDAKTRTLTARLKFKNTDKQLKPNMLVDVLILQNSPTEYLTIERDAVIRMQNENRVVIALGEGKFKSVNVTTGKMNHDYIEIKAGISAGERIVTSAQFLLDSESSKQSDFKRLSHPLDFPRATVNGVINSINLKNHTLNITRGAIKKWQRPPATLDFLVEQHINLNTLKVDSNVQFTFAIINGEFIIKKLTTANKPTADKPTAMEHHKHD